MMTRLALCLIVCVLLAYVTPLSQIRASRGRPSGRGSQPRRSTPRNIPRDARELDLFGKPGEWQSRRGGGKYQQWRNEKASVEVGGGELTDESPERAYAPPNRVWKTEAGGGRSPSFYAKGQSFADIGATDELRAALRECGMVRPSHIQAAGFAPILGGEDVALADQTGSGKTIAYLAPIVQSLRALETSTGRTPNGHIRALVLTPTSELSQQVLKVAKTLSAGGVPVRSSIITGEHKWRTQARCADQGLELLVCTPGRLRAHLQAEPSPSFSLASCRHLVLDEADLLFEDEDFASTWRVLRALLPARVSTALVTATLPEWMVNQVQQELPLLRVIRGPTLHRTGAGVREKVIDCSTGTRQRGDGDMGFGLKAAALMHELLEEPANRALIFCNTIESCRRVENFLRRRDRRGAAFEVYAFHGAIPAELRKRTLAAFTADSGGGYSVPRLLVCTDRASRGMDFEDVGHVVLFDFPRDGVEYVRRVGRATRGARSPGRITSLVMGRQLAYARELMKINREGKEVDLEVHGSARG